MDPIAIIFLIGILIMSVILHEIAHGAVALSHGDPTAKYAGRLTLNPIPHIDPIGSILVPGVLAILPTPIMIGWAKPVPVNPMNLRGRYADLKVSFAGPAMNLGLALVFGLGLRFALPSLGVDHAMTGMLTDIVFLNLILAIFNLVPIPPLDGSHILFSLLAGRFAQAQAFLTQYGFFILIGLLFLLPQVFFPLIFIPISLLFEAIVGNPFWALPSFIR